MRRKPVPPAPDSLDGLWAVQSAVPDDPRTERDCCARVVARTGVENRDDASDWLAFLRALSLARATDEGFERVDDTPNRATLARRFRDGVYGARDVLDALGETPRSADEVFAAFDAVPRWERETDGWEAEWRERVRRLLEWAVLLGLAETTTGGYRVTATSDPET
ncbi:hypothetical protein [Salarchaeum sp. JOR-1]|uniref:hypothetical protein n=1 Tax=Salarchaeum sp. JOR-1 TaxID=2599399 RepID=UPI001198C55E|nr:hypothetical protein [Salarchaeum sp. JOR-1]QDX40752.1 hypothetical protein FQU85_07450 [Salarchaeum sp. JOR-1]